VVALDSRSLAWRELNVLGHQNTTPQENERVTEGIVTVRADALNATIWWVRKTAHGFQNVGQFKTAIDFHCEGWLSPTSTKV